MNTKTETAEEYVGRMLGEGEAPDIHMIKLLLARIDELSLVNRNLEYEMAEITYR